ncbi:MAG: O-antigen ligase family protein [Geminocystis sp.]|nr:O-antigen ligase family protein [Geminocystis sp.]HIK37585.1 O-antigen ligase family protein [Geminocystis sp. M7585_C2015_104]MCS7146612.1 O-antigen ligase family protein [Geminocystis sp.]MCX8077489.1 O-antigen ligase family protein [Geminocystis sp.]MDW8115438.1 O-antigen ligase family protein [Geminocystis sp.]
MKDINRISEITPVGFNRVEIRWHRGELDRILLFFALFILPIQSLVGIIVLLYVSYKGWQEKDKEFQGKEPIIGLFLMLTISLIISTALAEEKREAIIGLVHFLPLFWVFLGVRRLVNDCQYLWCVILPFVVNSPLIAIIGVGEIIFHWKTPLLFYKFFGWRLTGEGTPTGRAASVFPYANSLALYLVISGIFAIALLLKNWYKKKIITPDIILLIVTVILDLYCLVLTQSRNGWILFFIAIIAFSVYRGWGIVIYMTTTAGVLTTWASFGQLPGQQIVRKIIPDFLWLRFSDQLYQNRPLEELRVSQWWYCLELIKSRPLFGWGLRNFSLLYEEKTGHYLGHPHNFFLMMMAETGIISTIMLLIVSGLVIMGGFVYLLRGKREKRDTDTIFFGLLMAFLSCSIYNLFDVSVFDVRLNIIAWILLAAIAGITHNTPFYYLRLKLLGDKNNSTPPVNDRKRHDNMANCHFHPNTQHP